MSNHAMKFRIENNLGQWFEKNLNCCASAELSKYRFTSFRAPPYSPARNYWQFDYLIQNRYRNFLGICTEVGGQAEIFLPIFFEQLILLILKWYHRSSFLLISNIFLLCKFAAMFQLVSIKSESIRYTSVASENPSFYINFMNTRLKWFSPKGL